MKRDTYRVTYSPIDGDPMSPEDHHWAILFDGWRIGTKTTTFEGLPGDPELRVLARIEIDLPELGIRETIEGVDVQTRALAFVSEAYSQHSANTLGKTSGPVLNRLTLVERRGGAVVRVLSETKDLYAFLVPREEPFELQGKRYVVRSRSYTAFDPDPICDIRVCAYHD